MAPFIYTMIVTNVLLWGILIKIVTTKKPDNLETIVLFLVVFLLTVTLTVTFPLYFYLYKKAPHFAKLKKVYRNSLKKGFYISLGFTSIVTLKIFDLFNIINLSLFLTLYIAVYWQMKNRL